MSILDQAKEAAAAALEKTIEVAGSAAEAVGEAGAKAKELAEEAGAAVAEGVSATAGKAIELATEAVDSGKELGATLLDEASGLLERSRAALAQAGESLVGGSSESDTSGPEGSSGRAGGSAGGAAEDTANKG
ncbi:MAG: hypothetical protein AW08_01961 [Candidatus Accumulibacter adjunctus]|uniref:Uncharacterized protein n=1 Tax=Candidatus Accumulibacter adjunctus TaxID=1454001 RepID=A0A011NSA3_9PROT|nr:MAG: hypothetical protein AW08_01961 [Candidatus Accumulibacter adjunctus]